MSMVWFGADLESWVCRRTFLRICTYPISQTSELQSRALILKMRDASTQLLPVQRLLLVSRV